MKIDLSECSTKRAVLHDNSLCFFAKLFDFISYVVLCLHTYFSLARNVLSLGNGRGSRVIRRGSSVIGRGSRGIGRGSKVEVEGQKSRSRVKSRGRGSKVEVERGSKVEGRNSRVENEKYYFFINAFLEYYIFGICCQNFKGSPDN